MDRRSSVICETRDCQVQITPAVLYPDGTEKVGTRVAHWSDPVWYIYIDPRQLDEHGMLLPQEQQRLSQMAEREHARG